MTKEHKLLKTQKNYVFKVLQKIGLEPANFSWKHQPTPDTSTPPPYKDILIPKLEYLDGEYYYEFGPYHYKFSPGQSESVEYKEVRSLDEQLFYVTQWAQNIKRQIEAPDLWAEIEKYRATLPLVTGEQLVNEPIPAYEAEEISSKLQLLADKIEEQFKLNEEQNQFVRSKLDYLADAAKRQPRRDWENIFIAVVINIAFQLALEPTKAQQLWQIVKSIVGEFIHFIGS